MQAILLSNLEPGTDFSFTGDRSKGFPCLLLDESKVDPMIKSLYQGGKGYFWHVYKPTGSLSYSSLDRTVWIP